MHTVRCDPVIGCVCEPGFTGRYCDQDVNECLSVNCGVNQVCLNTVGSYRCDCKSGYSNESGTCKGR